MKPPSHKSPGIHVGATKLSALGESPTRQPSQKELANILQITTRHLRRWEKLEAAANRPCSRPYTHADLWCLYVRQGRRSWNRIFAERSGLSGVFERFEQIRGGVGDQRSADDRFTIAAMMLRRMAEAEDHSAERSSSLPHMLGAGLANTARAQLLMILDCPPARDVFVKAFFEAALMVEARRIPPSAFANALDSRP